MSTFDYGTPGELFATRSEAELFPSKHRRQRREPVGYGRFARAAEAIRFAIEELPAELLPNASLEVDEKIFDRDGIRRLYDSNQYPLARRVVRAALQGAASIAVAELPIATEAMIDELPRKQGHAGRRRRDGRLDF